MKKLLFITLAIFITMGCQNRQKEITAISEIDSLFNSLYAEGEPGAALLILKGDEVLYDKGFGVSNYDDGTTIDGNTNFCIASISKQFAAVAILKLAENGLLSLDDNVKKFFPHFKADFFENITIRHLLSHTSGIPDARDRSNREFMLYSSDVSSYSYMENLDKLNFQPGEYYEYMNPTYQLFYTIIEIASGMPFEEYMEENIFKPAGMKNTLYFAPDEVIPNMSHGYIPVDESIANLAADTDKSPESIAAAEREKVNAKVHGKFREYDYGEETFFATKADGGLYTSTHEYAKWVKALKNNILISKASLELAHTPKISTSESSFSKYQNRPFTYYGYGWFIEDNPDFTKRVYHTGHNGGYQSYAGMFPDSDLTVIVFENRTDISLWDKVWKIDEIVKIAGWVR